MTKINEKKVEGIRRRMGERHRTVPKRLRQLRTGKGLKLSELSGLVGVSCPYLSQIEKGKQFPSVDVVLRLRELYGTSVDYMMGRTDVLTPYRRNGGGGNLEWLRRSNGYTQFELAKLLDYHSPTPVYRQEKNGISMTLNRVELLADYFEVPMDFVLGLTSITETNGKFHHA